MTREERINSALLPILEKMREHGATDEMCKMYGNGFHVGAMWAETHPHWISVEDGLPEVGVAVLTITPRGTQRVGFYEDGWWLANYIDLVRMGSITHWKPLPEAPKEGGAE